jgi:DNA-binding transcriptional LysR family regulator
MRDLATPTQPHKDGVLHFDLASLRIFIAVADELSITRAALREHMALSAVSKRVSELEQLAGSALLRRHARGVTLTPTGELLLSYATQIVQTLQRMRTELGEYASGMKGRVRIHANTWAITEFLPDELHAFAALHPAVEVDLEEHGASSIVRAVAEGSADLGIITQTTPALDLRAYPYHADHLVLVVPPTHALARRRSVRFIDTLDYEYVGYQADSPLQELLLQAAADAGRPLRMHVHVRSFEGMCRMVWRNMGIAILPAKAIRREARSIKIKSILLDEPWAKRQMHVCVRDRTILPLSAQNLLDHLIESARH